MSTNRSPVGRQPNSVYWRRRLAVLGGLVVIIVIIILIAARPGSGKPTAGNTNTNTPTNHTTVAKAPACNPADVQVIAVTDAASYAAGVDPMLSLKITNTGPAACSFKDGSDVQDYEITSGTDKIWSSKDCQTGAEPLTTVLKPSKSVSSTPFAWKRTRSNPSDCTATNAPQVVAGGASYHLTVIVNGVHSSAANSPQFVLR
jgi:hypothetical protein